MSKGVLEIDATYNDQNLKITWLDIHEIYTQSRFVTTINNTRYVGRLASTEDGKIKVYEGENILITCNQEDIVFLTLVKEGFADSFSAMVEVGLNVARAQNLRQLSTRASVGYRAEKWSTGASVNALFSEQSGTDAIRRTNGNLNFRYIMNKWYLMATVAMLSNTQQKIDIRNNSQVGMGRYLFSSNRAYWGLEIGLNNNLERFSNETTTQNSWEGLLGTELNLYDVGDLDLLLSFAGYSGLSDLSRYRADMNFDVRYEFPSDLFFSVGTSLNYDNQPAEDATNLDYVFRTGVGWEW